MTSESIAIVFNGVESTVANALTLARFIEEKKLSGRFVVIKNDEIRPKSSWSEDVIHSGDRIDIVTPISGG